MGRRDHTGSDTSAARGGGRGGRILLAGAVAAILLATLTPHPGQPTLPVSVCLVCGEHGAADALANILLFLPLGIACAWLGVRGLLAVAAAALLSVGVETAQLFLPGRDPSLGDVVCNTAGAALGVYAASAGMRLHRRGWPAWAPVAVAAAFLATVIALGLLLRPLPPQGDYYGQWTPRLGNLGTYEGEVASVTLGGMSLPADRLADPRAVAALLRARAPLIVRARAGPPPATLAPVFSMYTGKEEEVLLLGFAGTDLVFRHRTAGGALRLDAPDLRVAGAGAGIARGAPLSLGVEPDGPGLCLNVNARRTCGLGQTPGRLWALLYYPAALAAVAGGLLDALCIGLLLLPLGLTLRRDPWSAAGLLISLATLFLVPPWVGLLRPTPLETTAAGLALLGPGLLRFYRRSPGSPSPSTVSARASSATHRSMRV